MMASTWRMFRLALAVLALVLAGCSGNQVTNPKPIPPIPGPEPPELTIQRFVGDYEQKKSTAYQNVFTDDFTFEFSNATDPTLVTQYSTGWFKTDERESASHLFSGYTPPGGQTLPAATTIVINLATYIPSDDNTSPDPRLHKVLLTRVDGSITLPQSGGSPLTYLITNNLNEFKLVRGDAAASNLDSTQPADSTHWYIYRWVDLTGIAPRTDTPSVQSTSWASIKARFR
jgi:hypothetical protein